MEAFPQEKNRILRLGSGREIAAAGVIILSAAISMLAIAHTWSIHTQTSDEPAHIATGMELLATGNYELERLHPPLGRIFVAAPLALSGASYPADAGSMWMIGNTILHDGDYRSNVKLARIGVLPFFVILILATWRWSLAIAPGSETVAVVLLCSTSTLLAHAALATTDAPMTAFFVVSCWMFWKYAGSPSLLVAAMAGAAAGLAVAAKFSALPYLMAAAVILVAGRRIIDRNGPALSVRALLAHGSAFLLSAWILVFACYGGSTWQLLQRTGDRLPQFDVITGDSGITHDAVHFAAAHMPLVPPEFWLGLAEFVTRSRVGHPAYLLGMLSSTGWWYYFPIAVAVKTSVPTLFFALLAIWLGFRRHAREIFPVAAVVGAVLLIASRSNVNIGVRHVLPLYPLLCILAAAALLWLWRKGGVWRRALVCAAIVSQITSAVMTHPDHIAYFSLLAGPHPEKVLTDSNIDWGQDLGKLEAELKRRQVGYVYFACFCDVFLDRFDLPATSPLEPGQPVKGWVAISEMKIADPFRDGKSYAWLEAHRPVAMIGKSIRLYYIE